MPRSRNIVEIETSSIPLTHLYYSLSWLDTGTLKIKSGGATLSLWTQKSTSSVFLLVEID